MSRLVGLVLAGILAVAGCGGGAAPGPAPDVDFGVQVADSEAVAGFHARASSFYARLARRRFSTRATYRDPRLREYFPTAQAFSDYYADLAQALVEADFERSRPLRLEVLEFSFDAPGRARVQLRLTGDDGRPLRWGERVLEREDRWERRGGRWWLAPGKV